MSDDMNFELDESTRKGLLDRFLRYVKINTKSDEESKTCPSTECQWDLLRLLEKEARDLGLEEISLDENGYLFASLPANLPEGGNAPVVGLLAHVDTSPACSGENVKPQIIENYQGGDITLPGDSNQVITVADNPNLEPNKGNTLITTDGTTLLGGDDKAGVAIIMTVVAWLKEHPEVPHCKVRIGFTPDEEVGRGANLFDVEKFAADVAYTVDGSVLGEIEDETFCADSAFVTVSGYDMHPGFAKDKLKSAIRAASYLVDQIDEKYLPETTEGRESYLHPLTVKGDVNQVDLHFLVRAFTDEKLREREDALREMARKTEERFPGVTVNVKIEESYKNMKVVLDKHPKVLELALDAVRRAGIEAKRHSIRGGTDGARLSFMGLPTPNIFDGGQNFHSVKEWISLEWMSKSAETVFHILHLWGRERR